MASRAVRRSLAIVGYAQRLGYRVYRIGCVCWRRQGFCHSDDITRCASWAKPLRWSKIWQQHPSTAEYQGEESTELQECTQGSATVTSAAHAPLCLDSQLPFDFTGRRGRRWCDPSR